MAWYLSPSGWPTTATLPSGLGGQINGGSLFAMQEAQPGLPVRFRQGGTWNSGTVRKIA